MNKTIIKFFFEDTEEIKLPEKEIEKWILQIIDSEESIFGFINVVICSDKYLLNVNREYLNHDFFTDIITFDLSDNELLNTDIFISVDRVYENSKSLNINFYTELYRIISHGILHMIGYSDKKEEEKLIMRNKEDYYLNMMFDNEK